MTRGCYEFWVIDEVEDFDAERFEEILGSLRSHLAAGGLMDETVKASELRSMVEFLEELNCLEMAHGVHIELAGSYDSRYLTLRAKSPPGALGLEPYVGGNGDLALEREEPIAPRAAPKQT